MFDSGPDHTKGVKNGTSSSFADACIKGIVLGVVLNNLGLFPKVIRLASNARTILFS